MNESFISWKLSFPALPWGENKCGEGEMSVYSQLLTTMSLFFGARVSVERDRPKGKALAGWGPSFTSLVSAARA